MRKRKPWIYIVGILVLTGLVMLTACGVSGGKHQGTEKNCSADVRFAIDGYAMTAS